MPLPVGPLPRSVHLSVWAAKCHYHEANVVLLTEFLLQERERLSFSEFQSSLMLGVIGHDGRVGTRRCCLHPQQILRPRTTGHEFHSKIAGLL